MGGAHPAECVSEWAGRTVGMGTELVTPLCNRWNASMHIMLIRMQE